MDKNIEYIDELILHFFEKESTPEQEKELVAWIQEDALHEKHFIRQHTLFVMSQKQEDINFNTDIELQKCMEKIGITRTKSRKIYYAISGIAASIILIIGLWITFYDSAPKQQNNIAQHTIVNKITAHDSIQTITLEDKSEVTLQKNAIISTYSFTDSIRTVDLNGTAFFKVTHNALKPFVITVDYAKIRVLGTSFEVVQNCKDSSITVSVVEGKVQVYNELLKTKNIVTINQKITIYKHKKSAVETFQNLNFLAWKTRILEFKDTPLPQALSEIGEIYNKTFVVEVKKFDSYLFNATFNKTNFTDVKTVLEYTLNANVIENDSIVIIKAK